MEAHDVWARFLRIIAIAAIYAALTIAWTLAGGSLSWGPIQLRVSEALNVLALFTPDAIPALAMGCAVSNLANVGLSDLGTGTMLGISASTLLAFCMPLLSWRFRDRPAVAILVPLVVNVGLAALIWRHLGTMALLDVFFGALATAIGAIFGVNEKSCGLT